MSQHISWCGQPILSLGKETNVNYVLYRAENFASTG